MIKQLSQELTQQLQNFLSAENGPDVDEDHVISLLEKLDGQNDQGKSPAQQLQNLNTIIAVLDDMQKYQFSNTFKDENGYDADADQPTPAIDQDSKSLLLAGDDETFDAIQAKIGEVVSEYGIKIIKQYPIQQEPPQENRLTTLQHLNSQRSVSYDTPKKSTVQSKSSKQQMVGNELNQDSDQENVDDLQVKEMIGMELSKDDTTQPSETTQSQDFESSLQLILQTLCDCLSLQSKNQAAALLAQDSQYLKHAACKGLKGGNFKPIISWYETLQRYQDQLQTLVAKEESSLPHVVKVFSCGLASQNAQVAQLARNNLDQLFSQANFRASLEAYPEIQGALIAECITAYNQHQKHHNGLSDLVLSLLAKLFGDVNVFLFLVENLRMSHKTIWKSFFSELLPFYVQNASPGILDALKGIIIEAVDYYPEDKEGNAQLIIGIWRNFSKVVEMQVEPDSNLTILDITLKTLAKICRDESKCIQLAYLQHIFQLLQELAARKSAQSPQIYKLLTFSFIENFDNEVVREQMSNNFIDIFSNFKGIPVSVLVEPLLRKLHQECFGDPSGRMTPKILIGIENLYFQHFDLRLLDCLIEHNKFQMVDTLGLESHETATGLANILIKQLANQDCHPYLFKIIHELVFKLIGRIDSKQQQSGNATPRDPVPALYKLCLEELVEFEKSLKKKRSKSSATSSNSKPPVFGVPRQSGQKNTPQIAQAQFQWIQHLTLQIQKYYHSNARQLLPVLKQTAEQFQGKPPPSLTFLMSQSSVTPGRPSLPAPKRTQNFQSSIQNTPTGEDPEAQASQTKTERQAPLALPAPPARIRVGGSQRRRAQEQINEIRQRREEKEKAEKQEKEEQRKQEERQKHAARQAAKRNFNKGSQLQAIEANPHAAALLQLSTEAVEIRSCDSDEEEDDSFRQQVPTNLPTKSQIREKGRLMQGGNNKQGDDKKWTYLNIELEEQRDQDAIKLVATRNNKMIKYMFQRCGSNQVSQSVNNAGAFGRESQQAQLNIYNDKTVQIIEVTKLLRELGISQQSVSKNDISQLFKHINRKKGGQIGSQKLDQDGFVDLLLEISYFLFKDECQNDARRCFIELLKFFTKNSQMGHVPMPLPPYSEATTDTTINMNEGQREKVRMLERILVSQPNYMLPEGYISYKELQQVSSYKIPASLPMNENKRIALEMFDEILFKAVGVHFLEPMMELKQVMKVRPKFQHGRIVHQNDDLGPIIRSAEPSSRRARSERRLSPIRTRNPPEFSKAQSVLHQNTPSISFDPTSQSTKVSLNQFGTSRPPLPLSKPPKNRALQKRIQEQEREQENQQQRDLRFRKRQEAAKRALSEQRAARNDSAVIEEREKQKKDVEEKQKAKERQQRERQLLVKKQVEQQLEKRKEEQERLQKEKDEADKKQKRERSRAAKEFVQQQNQKLQDQFRAKQKQRLETEKNMFDEREKQEQQKQRVREKADKYYQEHTQDLKEIDQQEKEKINQLYLRQDIQQVLQAHQAVQYPIFKQYATQDKKQEIGQEEKVVAMNSTEFIKLCKQYGLSGLGKDISQEDTVQVFRTIMRDREESIATSDKDSKLYTSIEYQDYEKAMLRMHALWSSSNTQTNASKPLPNAKPIIDHSGRILKALNSISPLTLDQFLGKFAAKSLKGYATRGLKQDSSKGTLANNDLQHLDIEQPTVKQDSSKGALVNDDPTSFDIDQPTVKKEISKKIAENQTIKVDDLDKDHNKLE